LLDHGPDQAAVIAPDYIADHRLHGRAAEERRDVDRGERQLPLVACLVEPPAKMPTAMAARPPMFTRAERAGLDLDGEPLSA